MSKSKLHSATRSEAPLGESEAVWSDLVGPCEAVTGGTASLTVLADLLWHAVDNFMAKFLPSEYHKSSESPIRL
jgi:hypothetical protein